MPHGDSDHWERRHGLHGPWDPFQFIAVFAYVVFMGTMFGIHFPVLYSHSDAVFIVLIFLGLWVPFNIFTYVWASTTPAHDPGLDKRVEEWELPYAPSGMFGCVVCVAHVDEDSKHCWKCNKCISGFDHHCKWLNHCVGKRNYHIFALFLSNTTMLMGAQFGLSCWVLHYANNFRVEWHRACQLAYGPNVDSRAIFGFLVFAGLLEAIAWLPLLQLCWLHIYLKWRGISTYTNILENRDKKKQRRMEREGLGMGSGDVCCHDLAVWNYQRQREKSDQEKKRKTDRVDPDYKLSAIEKGPRSSAGGLGEDTTMDTNTPGHHSTHSPNEVDEEMSERSRGNASIPSQLGFNDMKETALDSEQIPSEQSAIDGLVYEEDDAGRLQGDGMSQGHSMSQVTLMTMGGGDSPTLMHGPMDKADFQAPGEVEPRQYTNGSTGVSPARDPHCVNP